MKLKKYILIILLLFTPFIISANRATQLDFLISGMVSDSAGNVVSKGKVYFYTAGTTNQKTIWKEKEKTNAYNQPLSLDSKGTKLVYGDGLYKIAIYNSDETQLIVERDNIWIPNYDSAVFDVADYNDIGAAITAISSNNAVLEIRVDTDIGTATTVGSNIVLKVYRDGGFTKSSTGSLTINGPFEAGYYKVFNSFSSGEVLFGDGFITSASPIWWGLSESASAATNEDAIDAAIESGVEEIELPTGTYNTDPIIIDKPIRIHGQNINNQKSILTYGGNSIGISITGTSTQGYELSGIRLNCTDASAAGIHVTGDIDYLTIDTVEIEHPTTGTLTTEAVGIQFNAVTNDSRGCKVSNSHFINNYYGIYSPAGTQTFINLNIENNHFEDCKYGIYSLRGERGWNITGNNFEDITYLGIYSDLAEGFDIYGNTFDIGSSTWSSFSGTSTTITNRNPMFFDTSSTEISAKANHYQPNTADNLFLSLGTKYIFVDPNDAIRTDYQQRQIGGRIYEISGVGTGSTAQVTQLIDRIASQTGDLVQYRDINNTVISGVTTYGGRYSKELQASFEYGTPSASGTATLNMQLGSRFWFDCNTAGTVSVTDLNIQISNGVAGEVCYLALIQDSPPISPVYVSDIFFNAGTYTVSTGDDAVDILGFQRWNSGSATGWMNISQALNQQ